MKDGGPAFPAPDFAFPAGFPREQIVYLQETRGMSLRDWFAGMALQGLMHLPDSELAELAKRVSGSWDSSVAQLSYDAADAMLAEREKQ